MCQGKLACSFEDKIYLNLHTDELGFSGSVVWLVWISLEVSFSSAKAVRPTKWMKATKILAEDNAKCQIRKKWTAINILNHFWFELATNFFFLSRRFKSRRLQMTGSFRIRCNDRFENDPTKFRARQQSRQSRDGEAANNKTERFTSFGKLWAW